LGLLVSCCFFGKLGILGISTRKSQVDVSMLALRNSIDPFTVAA
jgi:hypothetical protein